ncbi:MAG: DUF1570 domain-containing protein [Planctomycetes bacterium]|nr:DUF1570 domain-containing protein [Planctomycetota bacterium]
MSGKRRSIIMIAVIGAFAAAFAVAAAAPDDTASVAPTRAAKLAEFERRLAGIGAGDHAAAVKLAAWAAEAGLLDHGEALYRAVLREEPMNDEAYYALWDLCRARPPAKHSSELVAARAQLDASFVLYETRHFAILSDADEGWTRTQGDRLERTHDRFIRFANNLQLRPLPIDHKLVAVVFDDRADFVAFARADGNAADGRLAGYYSPAKDRLVFYHVESDENVASARRQLEDMQAEITAAVRASRRARRVGQREEARRLAEEADARINHLDEQERELNHFAIQRSISVTVHEAIHQLMFHTAVQSPYVQHPLWLTEGLATAFETDRTRSRFGPGQEFAPRRQRFYYLLDTGRLMPLRELVTADADRFLTKPGLVDAVYHQGYALVTWMARDRRPQLRDYLRALNALPSGVPKPATQLAVFERIFGDVDRVEEDWLRFEMRD